MVCKPFNDLEKHNLDLVEDMQIMVKALKERVEEESKEDNSFVGRVDPNKQLKIDAEELLTDNLVQGMNATLGEILLMYQEHVVILQQSTLLSFLVVPSQMPSMPLFVLSGK